MSEFDSMAEEAVYGLFRKSFSTCRSASGEYTVTFRFMNLPDAQKAYRDLCVAYMRTERKVEGQRSVSHNDAASNDVGFDNGRDHPYKPNNLRDA